MLKSPVGGLSCRGFWVNSIAAVRISGTSGSLDTGTRGLACTIAETSAIKVVKTSCVRCFEGTSARIASSIRLVTPIIRSHASMRGV